jgi:hypothetical protein
VRYGSSHHSKVFFQAIDKHIAPSAAFLSEEDEVLLNMMTSPGMLPVIPFFCQGVFHSALFGAVPDHALIRHHYINHSTLSS